MVRLSPAAAASSIMPHGRWMSRLISSRRLLLPRAFAMHASSSKRACPGRKPVGSRNRRRFKPRWARCRLTVRTETATPSPASSVLIRRADHFRCRRSCSIRTTTCAGVAVGWWCGTLARSVRPASPKRRWRLTHFDAHWREMPMSAATYAIGRCWQRAMSRRRPSTDSGGVTVVHGRVFPSGGCVGGTSHPAGKDPSASPGPLRRHRRHDPQQLAATRVHHGKRARTSFHVPSTCVTGVRTSSGTAQGVSSREPAPTSVVLISCKVPFAAVGAGPATLGASAAGAVATATSSGR